MKALVGRSVALAFKSLGDFVEQGKLSLPNTEGYDWTAQSPETNAEDILVDVVLVDEKLNHKELGNAQRWAIIKTPRLVEHFSTLEIDGRKYRCGTPVASYKFIAMMEVYEIL